MQVIKNKILLFVIYVLLFISFHVFAIDRPKIINKGLVLSDKIVAIVNDEIFTIQDLSLEERILSQNLEKKYFHMLDLNFLKQDALQNMIDKALIMQESNKRGILISDKDLNSIVSSIAINNNISFDILHSMVEGDGINWDLYLEIFKISIYKKYLSQCIFEENNIVSDKDVDFFLEHNKFVDKRLSALNNKKVTQSLSLAQILVSIPDNASDEEIEKLFTKANILRDKAINGSNFYNLAKEFSDSAEASSGGLLGRKILDEWPDLFLEKLNFLSEGQISDIVRSSKGFHILKILDIGFHENSNSLDNINNAQLIEQVHMKQILVKKTFALSDQEAVLYLSSIRDYIMSGKISFEEAAKQYSQDITAPNGGDIGWLNFDDIVVDIRKNIKFLKEGSISNVIISPEGYHLIEICDRRSLDYTNKIKKIIAYQYLLDINSDNIFDSWLEKLRNQSYIDIKSL